jgi:hypothetical protein
MRKRKVRKANTNVISVKLGTLTQDVPVATGTPPKLLLLLLQWPTALLTSRLCRVGDPVFCAKCQAALSAIDVAKMASEGKDKEKSTPVWHCLFCGTNNELNLDEEEVCTTCTLALRCAALLASAGLVAHDLYVDAGRGVGRLHS